MVSCITLPWLQSRPSDNHLDSDFSQKGRLLWCRHCLLSEYKSWGTFTVKVPFPTHISSCLCTSYLIALLPMASTTSTSFQEKLSLLQVKEQIYLALTELISTPNPSLYHKGLRNAALVTVSPLYLYFTSSHQVLSL